MLSCKAEEESPLSSVDMAPKKSTTKKTTADTQNGRKEVASIPSAYSVPAWRSALNIHQRVLAAIEAITQAGPLERESENTSQHYRFASHNAIKEALAPILVKFGILHIMRATSIESGSRQQPGSVYNDVQNPDKEVFFSRIEWEMQLVNTENPEDAITVPKWPSYSEDYGDKASSKAATIAEKTFLTKQFKITTTEDDAEGGVDQTRARKGTQRPVPPLPTTPAARQEASSSPVIPVTSVRPAAPAVPSVRPVTTASAPSVTPPPAARPLASSASTTPAAAETAPAPVEVPTEASSVASTEATIATLTEEQLFTLALPDKLPLEAIRVKLHNVGLTEAAKWVGKHHRAACPTCASFNRISLMIAAHQGASDLNLAKADLHAGLPPLAE